MDKIKKVGLLAFTSLVLSCSNEKKIMDDVQFYIKNGVSFNIKTKENTFQEGDSSKVILSGCLPFKNGKAEGIMLDNVTILDNDSDGAFDVNVHHYGENISIKEYAKMIEGIKTATVVRIEKATE